MRHLTFTFRDRSSGHAYLLILEEAFSHFLKVICRHAFRCGFCVTAPRKSFLESGWRRPHETVLVAV